MNHPRLLIALAGLAAILLVGCTKKDTRPVRVAVSGTVLRQGQPVAEATIIFEPQGSTPAATGLTDASGNFRLTSFDTDDGAVPGEYLVAIRKVQVIKTDRPPNAPDDFTAPPADEKWLLPVKYGHTSTSGLTASVKPDAPNNFTFELKD
jgi:hypothetical protein